MDPVHQLTADFTAARGALRTLRVTRPILKNPTRVFPAIIGDLAEKYGDAPALISERERLTYRQLAARSNRYARWARAQGIKTGDVVCLMMPNRPEYMAVWLGVTRAGGVVALLNTNLTGASLAFCINVVEPKQVIVASELLERFEGARANLDTKPKVWVHGETKIDLPRLDLLLEKYADTPLVPHERANLTIEDRAVYIYTSGTTGMPKAANINHYRLMLASFGFSAIMHTRASDRMYDCLPMYHTVGGVLATGALLVNGGSVFIRDKFSAHEFWDEVVRWDCTLFQYIGELCRYLVNTPPNPKETAHRLRLACGNGLRPDVWPEFKRRFHIPHILEFYAATEGNVTLFNFDEKEGSVGRIPWFLASHFPIKLVKFDYETEQPARGADGLCIPCEPGEIGEAIGQILNDPSKPAARFEGYASSDQNQRKILHDVLERGDVWFRTGDLMRQDKDGYFYFIDRVGDTFRWKGENVSTSQVSETITTVPGVVEANVYGVTIPGHDGRAGMAAIVIDPSKFDLAACHAWLVEHLPGYARPLFVRVRGDLLDVTATFKQKKFDLVRQGFDPGQTTDQIYFNDPRARAFVPVDAKLYDAINVGRVGL
jgi:fatty-acyl-CoA synthase